MNYVLPRGISRFGVDTSGEQLTSRKVLDAEIRDVSCRGHLLDITVKTTGLI